MSAGLAEVSSIVYVEEVTYPFTAFVSDIGGSSGLFLGLSIFGTLQGASSAVRYVLRRIFSVKKRKSSSLLRPENYYGQYYGKLVTEV